MSNTNERLKNRFVERYTKLKAAEHLFANAIAMFESLNSDEDANKVIENFLATSSKYDVNAEDLDELKNILHQFTSNELPHKETLAYLNYTLDIMSVRADHLLFIQDIFKCYW